MVKIKKKSNRDVAFTKRRKGLFRKCDELCKNYAAQIGVITFSEAGKLYPYPNLIVLYNVSLILFL